MRPEAREFLLACFAQTESSSRIEAFLRLQFEHVRPGRPDDATVTTPVPSLGLDATARRRAEQRLEATLRRAAELDAFLLTPWEPDYPLRLRGIAGPPPVLYGRGDRHASLDQSIAVVGTRTPSRWGRATAARVSTYFAERGWAVVSGLAIGIDRQVHETVMAAGGRTVAVVPAALDRIAPLTHRAIADRIVATGGLVVSEMPFGTDASAASRIARDRIQAGISRATVIIETEADGGAMHTARYARQQGRPLYLAMPPDTTAFQSRGNLHLLYAERVGRPLEVPGGLASMWRDLGEPDRNSSFSLFPRP